jgi:hypothetical protein
MLKELGQYLDDTSDTSAPGNSGVAWWVIKLGESVQWVLNTSLSLGIHPDNWKMATVVVIPDEQQQGMILTSEVCCE